MGGSAGKLGACSRTWRSFVLCVRSTGYVIHAEDGGLTCVSSSSAVRHSAIAGSMTGSRTGRRRLSLSCGEVAYVPSSFFSGGVVADTLPPAGLVGWKEKSSALGGQHMVYVARLEGMRMVLSTPAITEGCVHTTLKEAACVMGACTQPAIKDARGGYCVATATRQGVLDHPGFPMHCPVPLLIVLACSAQTRNNLHSLRITSAPCSCEADGHIRDLSTPIDSSYQSYQQRDQVLM
ncbi:hypothetical protein DMC30DRAFT_176497 [Rhodotorula diobovata]|uniref:Uncharacterized protein n=1 Tax=Rhodotorula diobovata TaxID=5288 RepID=A0A5C5FL53_9BASI|nr:hypothetical protein DMC30DRAFT_176497 [Rhodotorula diobovata]